MKKFLLGAICLLSFTCLKAQSSTSGHLTATIIVDSISHDSTTCSSSYYFSYGATIDSSYVGDSVIFVDTSTGTLYASYVNTTGVSPWTCAITWESWGLTVNDFALVGGYAYFVSFPMKVASLLDTAFVTPSDSLLVTNPCIYDTVQGYVYVDNNGNCIMDSGDNGLYQVYPSIVENLSSAVGTITNHYPTLSGTDGWYMYVVQKSWMVNYMISLPSSYSFIFPFSPCFSGYGTFTTLPQDSVSFPLKCTNLCDVQCNALAPATIRYGRPLYMQPYVSNTGCDTASGELTLILDSRVTYDSALSIYPADTVRGDTLIWNFSGLSNISGGAYWNSFLSDIYLSLDSSVVVGDTLCFSGYSTIPPTDVDPLNNSFAFCMPVVYSFDPNVKQVSPMGTGPQGYIPAGPDTLTYTLQFQNTGSAAAINISVIDTLDSHINASSLVILGASFNMTPQWLAPGVVAFNFNNINLPDSGSNFAASFGDVRFKVALNNGLAPGTQIKNTGYIYFDANPAVVTNTVLNTISPVTKVNTVVTTPAVKVYPNPATENITVENLGCGEISIVNLNGQVVLTQAVANNKTTIDVSRLPSGVYILKTVNNANTTTTKFTKY